MGGRKCNSSEMSEGVLKIMHFEIANYARLCNFMQNLNYAKNYAKFCSFAVRGCPPPAGSYALERARVKDNPCSSWNCGQSALSVGTALVGRSMAINQV